jgi:hypothetical protein
MGDLQRPSCEKKVSMVLGGFKNIAFADVIGGRNTGLARRDAVKYS